MNYFIKDLKICFLYLIDMVEFSDEEGYGKYLDLHECYEKFINLKGIEVRNNKFYIYTNVQCIYTRI